MMTKSDKGNQVNDQWQPDWGSGYITVSKRGSTSAVTTAKNFIRYAKIHPNSRVLDMGCGHGRITELLVKRVPSLDIVGVDMTRQLLDDFLIESGMNDCNLELVQANVDVDGLPFDDNEFDAAVSSRVFHYLSDPVSCLFEAYRVIKPGGVVVISIPNKMNPIKYLTYKRAKLYSPFEVAGWFRTCGFHNITFKSVCYFPSTYRWHSLASFMEILDRIPLLKFLGGNVLVWGQKG